MGVFRPRPQLRQRRRLPTGVAPPLAVLSVLPARRQAPCESFDRAVLRGERRETVVGTKPAAVFPVSARRGGEVAREPTLWRYSRRVWLPSVEVPPPDVSFVEPRCPVARGDIRPVVPRLRKALLAAAESATDAGSVIARRSVPRTIETERPIIRRVWPFSTGPVVPVDHPAVAPRKHVPARREYWQRLRRRIALRFPTIAAPFVSLSRLKSIVETRLLSLSSENRSAQASAESRFLSVGPEDREAAVVDDEPEC